MKNIFLCSYFKEVIDLFKDFKKELKGRTVSFIATASIVEEINFYVKEAKEEFLKLGIIVDELDISKLSTKDIEYKLKENDFIYISGGNSFFLLQELKRTKALELIQEEVKKGKLYIGESAGAIVSSKNISYIKDMDDYNKAPYLKDFEALDLTNFYLLPHYTNFPFEKITQNILDKYSSSLNIKAIKNSEAILIEDDKIQIKIIEE